MYAKHVPLIVSLEFTMPRPKSAPKSLVHPVKKPDADNLAKAILDALESILWEADQQVVKLTIEKKYQSNDTITGVAITVSPA